MTCSLAWADPDPITVSGSVSSAVDSQPVEGAMVRLLGVNQFGNANTYLDTAVTDASGSFTLTHTPADTDPFDIAIEAGAPGLAPARFDGPPEIHCFFACGFGGGLRTVSAGEQVTGIDFVLGPGATVSGQITAQIGSIGVAQARVAPALQSDEGFLRARTYSPEFQATADGDGNYQTPLGLPDGDFYFVASSPMPGPNLVTRAWPAEDCELGNCILQGNVPNQALPLAEGENALDIDFALPAGAELTIAVAPFDYDRFVWLFDPAGRSLGVWQLHASGDPAVTIDRLAGGQYYVQAGEGGWPRRDLVRKLNDGSVCPFASCDRNFTDPFVLPPGESLTLDFDLPIGGRLTLELIDASTGLSPPLAMTDAEGSSNLVVFDDSGTIVGGGILEQVEGQARLVNIEGLPAGEYYARTYNDWSWFGIGYPGYPGNEAVHAPGYSDGIHGGPACAGIDCDLAAAQKLTIVAGQTTSGVLELSTGSDLSGHVVDAATGGDFGALTVVKLVDADNNTLAATWVDSDGSFSFGGFPAGTYYLRTAMGVSPGRGTSRISLPFFDRVYGKANDCSERLCNVTLGDPIVLDGSSDQDNLLLEVNPGPVISGEVIIDGSGVTVTGGHVDVFAASGQQVGRYRIGTTGQFQTGALPPGDYLLVPFVNPAFSAIVDASNGNGRNKSSGLPAGIEVTMDDEDVVVQATIVPEFIFASTFSGTSQ